MKKQLNIICVLIFLVVGLSLVPSTYMMCKGFMDGFNYGMSQAKETHEDSSEEILTPVGINLWPKSLIGSADQVLNQKDQKMYQTTFLKLMVWIKPQDAGVMRYAGWLSIAGLFFVILAVMHFYKLINAINKEVIFDWINVRRLNKIGYYLLISFAMMQAYLFLTYLTVNRVIELKGYNLNYWCDFQSMNLILGLIALLISRIFAIGLRMKEEQELTI